jgi:hypothetical protein
VIKDNIELYHRVREDDIECSLLGSWFIAINRCLEECSDCKLITWLYNNIFL